MLDGRMLPTPRSKEWSPGRLSFRFSSCLNLPWLCPFFFMSWYFEVGSSSLNVWSMSMGWVNGLPHSQVHFRFLPRPHSTHPPHFCSRSFVWIRSFASFCMPSLQSWTSSTMEPQNFMSFFSRCPASLASMSIHFVTCGRFLWKDESGGALPRPA